MRFSVALLAAFAAGTLATPLPWLSLARSRSNSISLRKPILLSQYHNSRASDTWQLNRTSGWKADKKRSLDERDPDQRAATDFNVTRKVILKPTPGAPNLMRRDAKKEVEAAEGHGTAAAEKKSGLPKPEDVFLELFLNFTRSEQNATSNGIALKLNITRPGDDEKGVKKEKGGTKKAKQKVKGTAKDDDDDEDDDDDGKSGKKVKGDDKEKDDDDDDDSYKYKYKYKKGGDDDDDDDDDEYNYKHRRGGKDDGGDDGYRDKNEVEELKKEGDAAREKSDEDTDDATEAKARTKGTKKEAQQNKRASANSKKQTKAETKKIKEEIKGQEGSTKPLLHKRSANETGEHHEHRHEVNRDEFVRFVESVDRAEAPRNRINTLI